jgi:hypothetical protein
MISELRSARAGSTRTWPPSCASSTTLFLVVMPADVWYLLSSAWMTSGVSRRWSSVVCGLWRGINRAWHHLQVKIAAARAQKVWRELLCPSVSQARDVLLQHMQRRVCFAAAGARSRLRHDRIHTLRYGAGGGPTDYQSRARDNARGTHARSNCAGSRGMHHHGGWAWSTGVFR